MSSVDDVVAALRDAADHDWVVRAAGSLHSHSPVLHNDGGMILVTDDLGGPPIVDEERATARIPAGTKLSAIGEPLWEAGFSLANQGDVDVQSIAGLVGTGVHGTGPSLRSISASVVDATIVTGDGEPVTAADDPDLLEAVRLNLGALGVVTDLTLQLVAAYHLHERHWREEIGPILDRLPELVAATRHFEFFWYPVDDLAYAKALDLHPGPPDEMTDRKGEYVDRSYRVFPSVRSDKHTEMEYSVPEAAGRQVFAAVRDLMRTRFPDVVWPVEYRTVAADDGWISPASGRATVTISVHQGVDQPHEEFFRSCEEIFAVHDGRPHWGKRHYRSADELAAMYGDGWRRWWAVRDGIDPAGRFVNRHLQRLRPSP